MYPRSASIQVVTARITEPRAGSREYAGGVTLNLRFDDVDAVYDRLKAAGIEVAEPLADHPWGDRGFGLLDPSGLAVCCYHDIPMTDEFKPFLALDPGQREGEL